MAARAGTEPIDRGSRPGIGRDLLVVHRNYVPDQRSCTTATMPGVSACENIRNIPRVQKIGGIICLILLIKRLIVLLFPDLFSTFVK